MNRNGKVFKLDRMNVHCFLYEISNIRCWFFFGNVDANKTWLCTNCFRFVLLVQWIQFYFIFWINWMNEGLFFVISNTILPKQFCSMIWDALRKSVSNDQISRLFSSTSQTIVWVWKSENCCFSCSVFHFELNFFRNSSNMRTKAH